jgi:DNA-binding CsgD family transcriptional regulator
MNTYHVVNGKVKKLPYAERCKDQYSRNIKQGDPLSKREHEAMQLVAEGLSNKLIADAIGISDHTAKYHVRNALRKLGVSSRTRGAVLYVDMIKKLQADGQLVDTESECA